MLWWIIGAAVVIALGVVWWLDRRHHGSVDQSRVRDGVTRQWDRESFTSRRDYYRD
jgi:hypothetical protein